MDRELPFVSIIAVNYNGKRFLKTFFDSISSLNYPKAKLEAIFIDNGSQDDSIGFVKKHYPKTIIIENSVNNYCRSLNLGIEKSKGEFIALLNNDMKVEKRWLMELVKVAEQDCKITSVGSKILFMDGKINSVAHRTLPDFYWTDYGFKEDDIGQYDKIGEVDSICGGAVLHRRKSLIEAGCYDEDFNMYLEDVDISIRLKKLGWKLFYCPKSIAYHEFHGTASDELVESCIEKNRLLFIAKHYPEKIGEELAGKGYFSIHTNINNRNDIYNVLPLVF